MQNCCVAQVAGWGKRKQLFIRKSGMSILTLVVMSAFCLSPMQAAAATNPCAGVLADMMKNTVSSKLRGCSTDPNSPLSLDAKASKVPDTNYPVATSPVFYLATNGKDTNPGTLKAPMLTLQKALDKLPQSGGTIVMRGGTYHQGSAGTDKSIYLQPYAHEQVWFDGTVTVGSNSFKKSGSNYSLYWSTPSFCGGKYYSVPLKQQIKNGNKGPCAHYDNSNDPKNPMAVDPQMVFKDGKYIHEVEKLSQAKGDTFYYDQAKRTIYLGFNPVGHTIEVTKYPSALVLGGDKQVVRGIGFKRYATNEFTDNTTHGALYIGGTNALVQNSAFRQMAAQALYLNGRGAKVSHSVFSSNGFNSINSNGHMDSDRKVDGLTLENNFIYNSNTELFSTNATVSSGRAGSKTANMNSFTVRNNIFYKNNGYGFWCDNDCTNGIMINNTFINNERGGIVYEVSNKGIIASNLIAGTFEYGIRVCSAETKIYNNTVVGGTKDSIWIYDDPRSPGSTMGLPGGVGPDTRNVEFMNNIVYGTSQVLKISVADARSNNTNTTLKQLLKKFDYNEFYVIGSKKHNIAELNIGSVSSGTKHFTKFSDILSRVTTTDGKRIDPHELYSTNANGPFVSYKSYDFRMASSNKGHASGTKLPADVAMQLKLATTKSYDRGALSWPGR